MKDQSMVHTVPIGEMADIAAEHLRSGIDFRTAVKKGVEEGLGVTYDHCLDAGTAERIRDELRARSRRSRMKVVPQKGPFPDRQQPTQKDGAERETDEISEEQLDEIEAIMTQGEMSNILGDIPNIWRR
jgi:hypothetical protein